MNKVTITLEVTYEQLSKIATVLNSDQSNNKPLKAIEGHIPTTPTVKPVVPPAPKPGGKVAAKMPSFGRTQAQINDFIEHESSRVAALDEKEELRRQRAEEKAAAEAAAHHEAAKAKAEIAEINEALATDKAPMPPKLWNMK